MYGNTQQRRCGQNDGGTNYSNGAYNGNTPNGAGPSNHYHSELDHKAAAEKENDAILKALMADIKTIKTTHKNIGEEIGSQNKLLELLGETFGKAQGALGSAMKKVGEVGGMSSHTHMWLLIIFAFVVFLFIWFLLKVK
eukprot:GILI01003014.1.p1 GENE.GILI01003014.1~~GILI01003014.1.p1  ORF type:complete len:139 (+),score=28.45 GILI01003014.1:92-508(+)